MSNYNSQVILYKGVKLEPGKEDTLYFATSTAQNTYFSGLTPTYTSPSDLQYIRVGKGELNINASYDEVYQSNYMRFKNGSHENKWFYAFVLSVDYVNDETTKVNYEIDPLQTWLPGIDYTLNECYIDRQHSTTDAVGDSLTAENFGNLEYRLDLPISDGVPYSSDFYYVVQVSAIGIISLFTTPLNAVYDLTPQGYALFVFTVSQTQAMFDLFNEAAFSQYIEGVYTLPYAAIDPDALRTITIPVGQTNSFNVLESTAIGCGYEKLLTKSNYTTGSFGTYTPKNNKLYTAPYNFIRLVVADGKEKDYKVEDFYGSNIDFVINYNVSPPSTCSIYPKDYKGLNLGTNETYRNTTTDQNVVVQINNAEGIEYPVSNVGGYTGDLSAANLINQLPAAAIGIGGAIISGGASLVATGAAAGLSAATLSAASTGLGILGSGEIKHGGSSGGSMSNRMAHKIDSAYFFRVRIKDYQAKMIDSYFSAYGYAVNKFDLPNIHARQRFTYIKTRGSRATSTSVPTEYMSAINEKFDNGIRFWTGDTTFDDLTSTNNVLS